ncbi:MAG: tetratricopeptide repeat protein [Bacteroidaceae bacterium]|nr:tetratricopeptide repeat protein [Bacteroidaceae bacterium]MBQ8009032.1 tetratricopeptide repeat protein [Bacteroidaceae bacterium]MBR1542747.1 tetratricopeptide repeat protein [Bacteroidaceae bacterium]
MADQKKKDEALNVEEVLSSSEAFILKNKKTIVGAIVALVVVIAGIFAYNNLYKAPREKKAYAALFKGEQYFENDQFDLAINGDSIGFSGLLKVADEFSGTKAANLANAYAGLSYAHLGMNEEALKLLDKFSADDEMIAPAIKGAMGNCYVELGNISKAISLLQAAAKEADNNTLSPIFLQQAGELLVKEGKYDEAITAYQTIKDKYFRSYQSMDIDRFLQEAQLLKNNK